MARTTTKTELRGLFVGIRESVLAAEDAIRRGDTDYARMCLDDVDGISAMIRGRWLDGEDWG